ncbi:MAG TPA: Hpt domain-containing protein [Pirellulales bacterium]|nr:Hpt domain-containing protein [Pirellulales bacterium]
MDEINQQVLDAFQVEHREHLEAIRRLIDELAHRSESASSERLDDAFRRAHSMKGGARICALRPVETLGHRLETLFARMQHGQVQPDGNVLRAVNLALDMTEDWMAALASGQTPPEIDAALANIDAVLAENATSSARTPPPTDLGQRLRAAFRVEHQEYVTGIRSVLRKVATASEPIAPGDMAECFRMAHSMKGASRVANVPGVIELSERLEALFGKIRDGALECDATCCSNIALALDAIERVAAELDEGKAACAPVEALAALDSLLDRGIVEAEIHQSAPVEATSPTSSAAAAAPVDLVRVATGSLDRLVRSASQLQIENLQQAVVAQELCQLGMRVDAMQRDREALRKSAAVGLHHLSARPELARVGQYLDTVESQIRDLANRTRRIRLLQRRNAWQLASLGEQVQRDVRQTRMAPAESVFQGFRKMVRDLARDEQKQVELRVTGLDVLADRMVLQILKDPLMHILRNAVSHGIESPTERLAHGKSRTGRIDLKLETTGNRLHIEVGDDGRGIDLERVAEVGLQRGLLSPSAAEHRSPEDLAKLLFQSGFSTSKVVTELSGRGFGLSVVTQAVTRLQGEVRLLQKSASGTTVQISVPLSIATHRLLFVTCGEHELAIPLHTVERLLRLARAEIETIEGTQVVSFQRDVVPLVSLAQLLGISPAEAAVGSEVVQAAIVRSGNRRVAVGVDRCLGERDALIRELDGPAEAMSQFAGGVLLEDGRVALVINPNELLDGFKASSHAPAARAPTLPLERARPTVLVVDDSFTTRTLEKTLLEAHGYDVRIAVDGLEALAQLAGPAHGIDLVISDVQMPRLDGFGLLAEIKKDKRLAELPVILVTSLDKSEDQQRGLSLGADAYIVKRKFDHEDLLNTIRQII